MATGFATMPSLDRVSTDTSSHDNLSRLFGEHHRRVLSAAYRITGNMADAEDVTQAVFLRLARGGQPGDRSHGESNMDNVGSYLYRAAVNGALDLLRRRKTAGAEPLDLAAEMASTSSSPEAEASGRQLGSLLRTAISELPPRAAEMFTLRYLEELDNAEIAALMGTSKAVIAVTLHHTRSKLRKRLTELDGKINAKSNAK